MVPSNSHRPALLPLTKAPPGVEVGDPVMKRPWFKKPHAPPERVKEERFPAEVLMYTLTPSLLTEALGLPESEVPVDPVTAESEFHCQAPPFVWNASKSCLLCPRT